MNLLTPLHPYERAHCRRTAVLTQLLAELNGYPAAEIKTITQSALVHDIGKGAIPLAILHKPRPLSDEERMVIETHTTIGAHTLAHTHSTIRTAAIVALQHHERLDGSGYFGLRDAEIHPHAKLVAVADVFDALISPRPYHRPWGLQRTCLYLEELAGVQFDAGIVQTLLDNLEQVSALYPDIKTHNRENAYFNLRYAQ